MLHYIGRYHYDSLLLFSVAMLVGQVLALGQCQLLAQTGFKNQAPDLEVAFGRCCDDGSVLPLLGHLLFARLWIYWFGVQRVLCKTKSCCWLVRPA